MADTDRIPPSWIDPPDRWKRLIAKLRWIGCTEQAEQLQRAVATVRPACPAGTPRS